MSENNENKMNEPTKQQETPQSEKTELEPEDKWLIRDCDLYWDEYKECTSVRGRFHQVFIYGQTLNCNQWRKDYDSCCKWRDDKDIKSAETLIESEKARRLERLRAHYGNDTWKKRDSPPENWDQPLPEWMVKRDENTYLAARAKEIREGKTEDQNKGSSCCIM